MAENESTALTTTEPIQPEIVPAPIPEVHLVARNPVEMQNAQGALKEWLLAKLTEITTEINDLNAAIDNAKKHKWASSALVTQRNKAIQSQEYYDKMLKAVEAGYAIIPDFPLELFAIRVIRDRALGGDVRQKYSKPTPYDESPDIVAAGYGDYVSPMPSFYRFEREYKTETGKETWQYASPTGLREVAFPLRAARVEVMNATAEAMALKVFDQIGICPAQRKPDPLIIGQILAPRVNKTCSFIIAWHLNLRTL